MSEIIFKKIDESDKKIILPVAEGEEVTFILIGTEPGEKEIIVELKGEGARAQILGLFILQEGEVKVRTIQHHQAPNTTSDLLFKTILLDKARSPFETLREGGKFDYQGLIKIDKKAQGANAYQRNDNLMVGSATKVKTKPDLEILADDVRCTHGATVGKPNEDQLFYLHSRGLTKNQAEYILIEGFLAEVIDRIEDEKKRKEVKKIVIEKLKMNNTLTVD